MLFSFSAAGKLLLTSEYLVLDGAEALALPTKLGQTMSVSLSPDTIGRWRSYDADGSLWFEADFSILNYEILHTSDFAVAERLVQLLRTARLIKNMPTDGYKALSVETRLSFPRQWGLGTSSTLIYNLAQLFKIDPFELSKLTFGGSGYDIACAGARQAIVFKKITEGGQYVKPVRFNPPFKNNLFFVYLNKKQNSREGINRYRDKTAQLIQKAAFSKLLSDFTAITHQFLNCQNLADFDTLIAAHEERVAALIEMPRAKSLYFNDFWGEVKSLGAWGGDFIMATSQRSVAETTAYFQRKGMTTVLNFDALFDF